MHVFGFSEDSSPPADSLRKTIPLVRLYYIQPASTEFCKTFSKQSFSPKFQKSLTDSVQEILGLHGDPAASNKQKRVKVTLLL